MAQGVIKWFDINKGYGFIHKTNEPEGEFFFHYSEIQKEGFKKLDMGDTVEFDKSRNEKGWMAVNVKKLASAQPIEP